MLRVLTWFNGVCFLSMGSWELNNFVTVISKCLGFSCRIPGVFCRRKLLSRYRRTHGPFTYADYCLERRQPIRTVVYPRVLNTYRKRRPARQLYCLSRIKHARWYFQPKNNALSLSTLLFSTRFLSDVSWGKVRSLTE
jgi:hypothetical protein